MVFVADYRAAVSSIVASFVPVRVSDPTTRPSMALFIVTGLDYFVSVTTVHPPCINTCLASLASPPPRIIHTPPRLCICLVSLAWPPPRIAPTSSRIGFTIIAGSLINILFDLAQERREIPAVCWGLDIENCPRVTTGSLHRVRADRTMIKTALVELLLD
jgi:hypothetical protein